MSGYSKTKLIDKLGIKPGYSIYLINSPVNYFEMLGELPDKITIIKKISPDLDFIHFFTKDKADLEENFSILKNHLSKKGMLWVSWPKGSSKIPSDINENTVRQTGLREGLVDVKVCAINEIWSGLKFVYRTKDRLENIP